MAQAWGGPGGLGLLSAHRWALLLATLMSLFAAVLAAVLATLMGPAWVVLMKQPSSFSWTVLLGPGIARWIVDHLGLPAQITYDEAIAWIPCVLVVGVTVKCSLMTGATWLWEVRTESIAINIRRAALGSLLQAPPVRMSKAADDSLGERFSALIVTDARLVREYLAHFFGGLPRELLLVVFYLWTCAMLSPELFVYFLLGIAPGAGLVARIGRKLRRRAAQTLEYSAGVSDWIQLRLLGIETIKHYGTEQVEMMAFATHSDALVRKALRAERVKARTAPTMDAFAVVAIAGTFALALHMIHSKGASGSTMVSFFAAVGFMSQSLSRIGRYYNANREGQAALGRLREFEVLCAAAMESQTPLPMQRADLSTSDDPGRPAVLEVRDLTVRYPDLPRPALADVTLLLHGGAITTLAGASGSGKSTLVRVLLRLVRPDRGALTFDHRLGANPKIAFMPQLVQLVPGTLASNVTYPLDPATATPEAIRSALRAAGIEDMVMGLPAAEATVIPVGPDSFSGGERQRILLARLFFHRPHVAVIDEGTSALDPDSQEIVLASLRRLANQGCAVLIVAHRPRVIEVADYRWVLQEGRLVARSQAAI